MEKIIRINNERILKIQNNNKFTISEYFIKNGDLEKSYTLLQWDDYFLNAFSVQDKNAENVSFDFDINHPLYFPLRHMLKDDESLIIYDDDAIDDEKKHLELSINDNIINLNFVNKLDNNLELNKFRVFVKNDDLSNEIEEENLDTKDRVVDFFKETRDDLSHNYHQISIEEYVLKKELKKII